MQVHRDINNLPSFKNAVVTIGTFDGVHMGHVQILKQLIEEAKRVDGETVIITFHPHPRMIIKSDKSEIKLLNTLQEKLELLDQKGIDHVVVVPFNKEFSELTAEEYIKDFLVKTFAPHTLIIGYDHHFGNQRKGNYKLLEEFGANLNFCVKEIPEHVLSHVTISSTKIREALLNSDIDTANKYLGYSYFFKGKVVEGNKIGRTIEYPTANIELADTNKLVPGKGIYAVQVKIDEGDILNGMMSIGIRPTIEDNRLTVEVNIFDFDKNIYEETLTVFIKKYLREEKKFSGLDELRLAIDKDKIDALKYLS